MLHTLYQALYKQNPRIAILARSFVNRFRRNHLVYLNDPAIRPSLISITDNNYRTLKTTLKRCRSFPYELRIFQKIEPETQYLRYLTTPNKISMDVGANIGFYAALLSPLSEYVLAWEANRNVLPFLLINTQRYSNIHLLPIAANATSGEVDFSISPVINADPLIHSGLGGLTSSSLKDVKVTAVTKRLPALAIDALQLTNVGFIKIDVEGSEETILQGAITTIEKNRPCILIENEYRHNHQCEKVFTFFKERHYQGYFIDRESHKLRRFESFSLAKNQIDLLDHNNNITDMKRYIFNFMFVPEEKDPLAVMYKD